MLPLSGMLSFFPMLLYSLMVTIWGDTLTSVGDCVRNIAYQATDAVLSFSLSATFFHICTRLKKRALLWSLIPDILFVIYRVAYALVWTLYRLSFDTHSSLDSQVLCCRFCTCW